MRRLTCLSLVFAALAAACGGSSPASPSGRSGSGATINGSIVAPGGTGSTSSVSPSAAAPSAVPGLVVAVAGTNVSAAVDQLNRFVLRGVPSGDVQLQFTAPTLNAVLDVPDVQASETITLAVSVEGTSSVVLESQSRSLGSQEQLEGRVESLPPTTPAGSLVVGGRAVTTDPDTKFYIRGASATFADLAIGQRVHVKGQTSGLSLLATSIDIQNTNVDIPVEINGTIQAFSGTSASFQFTIDGRLIKGDVATEFFGGSQFSQLANGRRAEVKGLQRDGYVLATRIHVNVPPSQGPEESASIEGLLTSKTGSVPLLTLVVGGTTVRTSASTEVHRRGDVQDLSVLALNMTLHVVGTRQTDGSIDARMIQIKEDATGGLFEISGSAGGVKGTCPSLTFGVNGYDIFTDGLTTFTLPCADLKSGTKVKVKGVVQTGGRVKATSVEKQ